MTVYLNDTPRELPEGATLQNLIEQDGLAQRKGIALALDQKVVPRTSWENTTLTQGQKVILIEATAGG